MEGAEIWHRSIIVMIFRLQFQISIQKGAEIDVEEEE